MAPKIKVPADFGREHINSPVHGNLVLKLRDGQEIKTNSMIMSLNSPVIDNLTTNLTQSSLEMDDFTKEAVDCFVESLYTGEVESLKKQIFEDVNKMAHVFEVSWLSKRCLMFYKMDILNYENNSYQELLFACEIASRTYCSLKQKGFVRHFVKDLMFRDISRTIFLQRYLSDFAERSRRQIDMSIAVAGQNLDLILIPFISHVTNNLKCRNLDENSRYLLQQLNVAKFRTEHQILFKDTVNLLLEISELSESSEVKEFIQNFVENPRSSRELTDLAISDDWDNENSDDEFTEYQNPEHCWVQAISGDKYPILFGNSVHFITTANEPGGTIIIDFYFLLEEGGKTSKFFAMNCINGNRWSFIVYQCTVNNYNQMFLTNVPDEKLKHWILTKTSTHLIVNCNKVTVLKFNFADDSDSDKKNGYKTWSRKAELEIGLRHKFNLLLTFK